jgi:hypothetical protein
VECFVELKVGETNTFLWKIMPCAGCLNGPFSPIGAAARVSARIRDAMNRKKRLTSATRRDPPQRVGMKLQKSARELMSVELMRGTPSSVLVRGGAKLRRL